MPTRGSEITQRFLAAPTDAGHGGNVGAGRVMEWIDKAGYACAVGWSGRYCVTAYVGNVSFTRPVSVGDLVEARARIVSTGRSSMNVLVTVASGDPRGSSPDRTTECLMVFVAVDDTGRPIAVPSWAPTTPEESELHLEARRHAGIRSEIEAAMAEQTYSPAGTAPRTTLRFLAAPVDVNWGGKVHGGVVMRWIDEAAHVLVTRWTRSADNSAVYIGGVRFYRPLLIGHLVEVEARLLHTGTTSMHVSVHVRSADPATTEDLGLTTHCLTVFVGQDRDGLAQNVPAWRPVSAEDEALDAHARHLISLRGGRPRL
jgi:4-hydroxybenzoyl-CoA thioesterase